MHNYIRIALILFIYTGITACTQPDASTQSDPDLQHAEATSEQSTVEAATDSDEQEMHILFYGDSITAGYGLELEQAFPALVQEKIRNQNRPFRVTNAGLSGETSSGGLNRIDWLLRQPVDIFVLELGGNDGLRGISLDLTTSNLQAILDRVKEINPNAALVVAGMQIPPNLGTAYTNQFKNLYPDLAAKNDALLIPFILEGVAGMDSLNLPDGIHPTAEGHAIIAETVWEALVPIMDQYQETPGDCSIPEDLNSTEEQDCTIDMEAF